MKTLVIGSESRVKKFWPGDMPFVEDMDIVYATLGEDPGALLERTSDVDFIMADAIASVPAELIDGMPNLKLVHTEGVAYNGVDLEACQRRGIPVCNNKGVNADAVAEQAVLLMLACLRTTVTGDAAVRAGRQIEFKERRMVEGIEQLSDCTVGIIGLGAIGQELAKRLHPFGCEVLYHNPQRKPAEVEEACHVSWLPEDELLARCDIVSLNMPVTPETTGSVDATWFSKMKQGSYLINTARGELVDQEALAEALESGHLAGAGLDTLSPEPVTLDNPLLNMSDEAAAKVVFSPHLGGITTAVFRKVYRRVWENFERVANGEQPINRVV